VEPVEAGSDLRPDFSEGAVELEAQEMIKTSLCHTRGFLLRSLPVLTAIARVGSYAFLELSKANPSF
jgi:hypothetical protein